MVHCEIYATNHVDPIAFTDHLHHQIGNTSTTNESTGRTLFRNPETSCTEDWFTSAGWFPVKLDESVRGVNVYYRGPGDQSEVSNLPRGLQLLGTEQQYNCERGVHQASPVYSCDGNFQTRVIFPDCWNGWSLEEDATVYGTPGGTCPDSHPIKLPRINFGIAHDNADGVLANPLMVSAGEDTWEDYTFMHGDYFSANQPVFNRELLDLCLRNVPDSVTSADPRCG